MPAAYFGFSASTIIDGVTHDGTQLTPYIQNQDWAKAYQSTEDYWGFPMPDFEPDLEVTYAYGGNPPATQVTFPAGTLLHLEYGLQVACTALAAPFQGTLNLGGDTSSTTYCPVFGQTGATKLLGSFSSTFMILPNSEGDATGSFTLQFAAAGLTDVIAGIVLQSFATLLKLN